MAASTIQSQRRMTHPLYRQEERDHHPRSELHEALREGTRPARPARAGDWPAGATPGGGEPARSELEVADRDLPHGPGPPDPARGGEVISSPKGEWNRFVWLRWPGAPP